MAIDMLTRGQRNKLLKDLRAEGRKGPRLGYCVRLPDAVAAKWKHDTVCRSYFPATKRLFPKSSDYYMVGYRSGLSGAGRRRRRRR